MMISFFHGIRQFTSLDILSRRVHTAGEMQTGKLVSGLTKFCLVEDRIQAFQIIDDFPGTATGFDLALPLFESLHILTRIYIIRT